MAEGDARLKSSATRLWKLVEERTQVGSDTETIDQRIWELFGEERAVLFTDLSGFSRAVGKFGIVHFLQVIYEKRKLLLPVVERHDGILIKIEADSFLVLFRGPRQALACAIEMQKVCQQTNARRPPEEQIILCCGVGFGKMLVIGDDDVFGQEVNLASKLGEDVAKGDEILVTKAALAAIGNYGGVRWDVLELEVGGETGFARAVYRGEPSAT